MEQIDEIREYRAQMTAMGTLIPGMTVRVWRSTVEMPGYQVKYLGYEFDVESVGDGKAKITHTQSDKRRCNVGNISGTIVTWASKLASADQTTKARNDERAAEQQAKVLRFRSEYGDVIDAANAVTGNKRKMRFERHRLNEHLQLSTGGLFAGGNYDFWVTDTGSVRVEITMELPHAAEGIRRVMEPSVQLLHAVAKAIAEAKAGYALMADKVAEKRLSAVKSA